MPDTPISDRPTQRTPAGGADRRTGAPAAQRGARRGLAPPTTVLAFALLVTLGAGLSGAVLVSDGAALVDAGPPPQASLSLSVSGDTLSLTHRGGDALDATRLRLVVRVDGDPLVHQPPVPFFSAAGFRPGPTGPFNSAADPEWTAGETATLRIAGTNRPTPAPGDRVTVCVYRGESLIAALSARA
jgi:hypothetical protein